MRALPPGTRARSGRDRIRPSGFPPSWITNRESWQGVVARWKAAPAPEYGGQGQTLRLAASTNPTAQTNLRSVSCLGVTVKERQRTRSAFRGGPALGYSQKSMKIILASPRGFCAGVNMAIESLE